MTFRAVSSPGPPVLLNLQSTIENSYRKSF